MGILGAITGLLGIGRSGKSPVQGIADTIDQFVFTNEEKEVAAQIRMRMAMEPDKAQTEINKIEAGHRSLFVAGWRPFIGWVGGIGLAWVFIGHPIAEWIVALQGLEGIVMPELQTENLMELVTAMLGFGGLRTFEKMNNKSK